MRRRGFLYPSSMRADVTARQMSQDQSMTSTRSRPRPQSLQQESDRTLPHCLRTRRPTRKPNPHPILGLQTCGRPTHNLRSLSQSQIHAPSRPRPTGKPRYRRGRGDIRTRSVFGTGTCVCPRALSAWGSVVPSELNQRISLGVRLGWASTGIGYGVGGIVGKNRCGLYWHRWHKLRTS